MKRNQIIRGRVTAKAPKLNSPGAVPWRAIAFDLDDTLYSEGDFVRSGLREVAVWCGNNCSLDPDATYRELLNLFEEGTRGTIFDSWVAHHGLSSDMIREMVQVYREHYPRINTFPGVQEMLSSLRKDFRLGLLSDGILAVQERKLSALGIRHEFEVVVFTDRLGRGFWKPSVEPFLELMRVLDVSPEEAVYVGDNPVKDFVACAELGMHSIWFRQPKGIYSALNPQSDGRPDYVVSSVDDIAHLLRTGEIT